MVFNKNLSSDIFKQKAVKPIGKQAEMKQKSPERGRERLEPTGNFQKN